MPKLFTAWWRANDALAKLFTKNANNCWKKGLRKASSPEEEFRKRWETERKRRYPFVDQFEDLCGKSIDLQWFHKLAWITSVPDSEAQPCYQHGRIVYAALSRRLALMERMKTPVFIFETGTARGLSTLCMLKSLEDEKRHGTVTTVDILPHSHPIYWNCLSDYHGKMSRQELLINYASLMEGRAIFLQGTSGHVMQYLVPPRIHFAYLDGEHNESPVRKEVQFISDCQYAGDVILFDDYMPDKFPGVTNVVNALEGYKKETINIFQGYQMVLATKM